MFNILQLWCINVFILLENWKKSLKNTLIVGCCIKSLFEPMIGLWSIVCIITFINEWKINA
jgi:hypothetical protein